MKITDPSWNKFLKDLKKQINYKESSKNSKQQNNLTVNSQSPQKAKKLGEK